MEGQKLELVLKFPIIKAECSKNYALIIIDSSDVIHYFNYDGSYDGYSLDCNNPFLVTFNIFRNMN